MSEFKDELFKELAEIKAKNVKNVELKEEDMDVLFLASLMEEESDVSSKMSNKV